jgi:hypothetical protein
MTMRQIQIPLAAICLLVTALEAPSAAQPVGREAPCRQIAAACQDAGFERNAAPDGSGLVVDCLRPLMQGTPQRPRASKALPEVDPQLIAACKANNPNFGQARLLPPEPAAPPPPAPAVQSPPPQARATSGRHHAVVIILTDDLADDLVQYAQHILRTQNDGAGARDAPVGQSRE